MENDFSVLQISERRAKAASSLRASIAANAARVPCTFLEKHQEAYDHQSESKVTRDTNALKRKTVPFARTKASKAAAVAQPISKKPRLADSPMPPLRHPTDAVPSAAPEPAATPPPPPFAAAARAAAAPAPAAHSASNFAASAVAPRLSRGARGEGEGQRQAPEHDGGPLGQPAVDCCAEWRQVRLLLAANGR